MLHTLRRTGLTVVLTGILVLVLAACGGSESSATTAGGFGVYGIEREKAQYRFTIPAVDDDLATRVDAFLKSAASGGDVSMVYILAGLDNSNGDAEASINNVSIVTDSGETMETRFVSGMMAYALNKMDGYPIRYIHIDALSDREEALYAKGLAILELTGRHSALPGAKLTTLLFMEESLPSVQRVFTVASILEPAVELRKISD